MDKSLEVPIYIITVKNNDTGFIFKATQYGCANKSKDENIKSIMQCWEKYKIQPYQVIDCEYSHMDTLKV
jgi:hypothetical protein